MATKIDIRDGVLKELGRLAIGQVAAAEDAKDVEDRIEQIHAGFIERDIAYWDIDLTPENVFDPYVKIIAYRMAATFEVTPQKMALLREGHSQGLRDLYAQTYFKNVAEPTKARYF